MTIEKGLLCVHCTRNPNELREIEDYCVFFCKSRSAVFFFRTHHIWRYIKAGSFTPQTITAQAKRFFSSFFLFSSHSRCEIKRAGGEKKRNFCRDLKEPGSNLACAPFVVSFSFCFCRACVVCECEFVRLLICIRLWYVDICLSVCVLRV